MVYELFLFVKINVSYEVYFYNFSSLGFNKINFQY